MGKDKRKIKVNLLEVLTLINSTRIENPINPPEDWYNNSVDYILTLLEKAYADGEELI